MRVVGQCTTALNGTLVVPYNLMLAIGTYIVANIEERDKVKLEDIAPQRLPRRAVGFRDNADDLAFGGLKKAHSHAGVVTSQDGPTEAEITELAIAAAATEDNGDIDEPPFEGEKYPQAEFSPASPEDVLLPLAVELTPYEELAFWHEPTGVSTSQDEIPTTAIEPEGVPTSQDEVTQSAPSLLEEIAVVPLSDNATLQAQYETAYDLHIAESRAHDARLAAATTAQLAAADLATASSLTVLMKTEPFEADFGSPLSVASSSMMVDVRLEETHEPSASLAVPHVPIDAFALPPQASPADTSADVARRSLESPDLAPAGPIDTNLGSLVNEAIALGHGYPTQTIKTELSVLPVGIRLMLVGGHRGPERTPLARPPLSRSERTSGLLAASTSELSTRYQIPRASCVEKSTRRGP